MCASKKIYFISDLHLGNRYMQNPLEAEQKLLKWLDIIKQDAAAVYFLGDIFDYWFEYKYVIPRGYMRFLGKVTELSDSGIEIHFLIGNHEIRICDFLSEEVGVIIHHKPFTVGLLGKNFFLAHGDEVGYRPLKYRFIQSIIRNRLCQVLYAAIHPRWSVGLARSWSLKSRKSAFTGEKIKSAQVRNSTSLEEFSRSYLQMHPDIHFFIFGHLHILLDRELSPTARLLIPGDWMYLFSYAVWDGEALTLNRFPE